MGGVRPSAFGRSGSFDYDGPEAIRMRKYATGTHVRLEEIRVETGTSPATGAHKSGERHGTCDSTTAVRIRSQSHLHATCEGLRGGTVHRFVMGVRIVGRRYMSTTAWIIVIVVVLVVVGGFGFRRRRR
jgi:hypothetical protein